MSECLPLEDYTTTRSDIPCPVEVDGRVLLASASYDRTVRLWDPARGGDMLTIPTHRIAVAVTPVDGSIAVGLAEGLVAIDLSPRLTQLR